MGLGPGPLSAPVFAALDLTVMPGTMLLVTSVLPIVTSLRADGRRLAGWECAIAGAYRYRRRRVRHRWPTHPAITAVVVAVVVLGAVPLSVLTWKPRPTPSALIAAGIAGVVSGIGGTATSVGGPPVALLEQRPSGPRCARRMGLYAPAPLLGVSTPWGELERVVETTGTTALVCRLRGAGGGARRTSGPSANLPSRERPVTLLSLRRLWRCPEPACAARTWSEMTEELRSSERASERVGRRAGWSVRTSTPSRPVGGA